MNSGQDQVTNIVEQAAHHWHMEKDPDDIELAVEKINAIIGLAVHRERRRWISARQEDVLNAIEDCGPLTLSQIAKHNDIALSTAQKALERLIKVGLVQRVGYKYRTQLPRRSIN